MVTGGGISLKALALTGIISILTSLGACSPRVHNVVKDPWFETSDLQGRIIVLMPALVTVEGESGRDIDRVLAEVMRDEMGGDAPIVDAQMARDILGSGNDADLLQWYYRTAFNPEWGQNRLRLIGRRLQDATGALYLLIPQLKSVTYDQYVEAGTAPSGERYVKHEKRISRTTTMLKVSIISTADGAVVWSGETSGDKSDALCAAPIGNAGRRRASVAVEAAVTREFPAYPPVADVTRIAFTRAMFSILGTSAPRRLQFMLESEPVCP